MKEDIIRMAREAKFQSAEFWPDDFKGLMGCVERFAALVRADELRRIEKLERINAQLLEALLEYKRLYEEVQPAGGWQGVYETGNAAIKAAKGGA